MTDTPTPSTGEARMREVLKRAYTALESLPQDCLGFGEDVQPSNSHDMPDDVVSWPLRDELLAAISRELNAPPVKEGAITDGLTFAELEKAIAGYEKGKRQCHCSIDPSPHYAARVSSKTWNGLIAMARAALSNTVLREGEIRNAALEEAAKACDDKAFYNNDMIGRDRSYYDSGCFDCASIVRALKSTTPPRAIPSEAEMVADISSNLHIIENWLLEEAVSHAKFSNLMQERRTADYKARGDADADYRGMEPAQTKQWAFASTLCHIREYLSARLTQSNGGK